jgi:hypothetical protein
MNKLAIAMYALFFSAVQRSIASTVEVVMHVDTEMPCLKSELLSGTVVIRNNGDKDIKLPKGTSQYPDMLVHEQLYLFPSIPTQKEKDLLAGHGVLGGQPSRTTIKEQVDAVLQNSESTVTLKKGESLTINFDNREISASILSFTRERIPFAAELYLPPNNWIPVEVRPPVAIACDAKIIPVATGNNKHRKKGNAAWVFRVRMGTNEFLCANSNSSTHRLLDILPDDTVSFSNQTITVKQKTGDFHIIPERDIPWMIDKRRNENRRKAR